MENPKKLDSDKLLVGLIRPEFIEELAKGLTYGFNKYKEQRGDVPNYLKGEGFNYSRIYDSLQRHLNAWYMGIDIDEESGIHHLSLAAANIMFLITYFKLGKGKDDRLNKLLTR